MSRPFASKAPGPRDFQPLKPRPREDGLWGTRPLRLPDPDSSAPGGRSLRHPAPETSSPWSHSPGGLPLRHPAPETSSPWSHGPGGTAYEAPVPWGFQILIPRLRGDGLWGTRPLRLPAPEATAPGDGLWGTRPRRLPAPEATVSVGRPLRRLAPEASSPWNHGPGGAVVGVSLFSIISLGFTTWTVYQNKK